MNNEKNTIPMEQLSNQYSNQITEASLKKNVILKKLEQKAKNAKESLNQIQLGDDSKVEEAIIISFFASLFDDMIKAYDHYKKYHLELQSEKLKKSQGIQNFKDHVERINKYTVLKIEKTYLENKIAELKETQEKNQKDFVVEITDNPDELLKLEKRFEIVHNEIDAIAEFYESKSEFDFMEDIEKVEEQWFGEEGANYLKCIRELDSNRIDELLENVNSLSGGSERVNGLKNAYQQLESHFNGGGRYDEKAHGLVSAFMKKATEVQGSITIGQLAKEGAEIQKKEKAHQELMQ